MNLPLFERHDVPILVITPEDDPLKTEHEQVSMGFASHSGEFAWRRLRLLLKEMASRDDVEHFALLEYDSFFLTKKIPMTVGLCGLVQTSHDADFFALKFPNPPWTMDDLTVKRFHASAEGNLICKERGFADRYWAALAEITDTAMLDYDPPGFTRNTIEEKDLPMVNRHLGAGAFAFHGVKTRVVRDYIVKVWNSLNIEEARITL